MQIIFKRSIKLLPGQKCSLYIHSGLPDDLGIQYQSYGKGSIVAEDDHLLMYPGLGHTVFYMLQLSHYLHAQQGCEPFDEINGWYRAYRGLSGTLNYRCQRKMWNIWCHRDFPLHFRECVKTVLLCRERRLRTLFPLEAPSFVLESKEKSSENNCLEIGLIHTHILYYIMEFMVYLFVCLMKFFK